MNNTSQPLEPILDDIPCIRFSDLEKLQYHDNSDTKTALLKGLSMGCFWVDMGKPGTSDVEPIGTSELWECLNSTFDVARSSARWSGHRFAEGEYKYLDALMHSALDTGVHYFERPNFQSFSTFRDLATKRSVECYEDIHPTLLRAEEIMSETGDIVLGAAETALGLTAGNNGKGFLCGGRRSGMVTCHRVHPDVAAHMAAEPHFDFSSCNILLYNYVEGFKVYSDKTWYRLAEPAHPNMLLFNMGSVMSVKTNRSISALFHKVDTPRNTNLPPRLSIVCVIAPEILDRVFTHPKFITSDSPELFGSHRYLEHVMYSGGHYTNLNEHVVFDGGYTGLNISFKAAVKSAIWAKAKKTKRVLQEYFGILGKES